MATVSKYKNLLERKKNKGILKLGETRAGGVVISQRQGQDDRKLSGFFGKSKMRLIPNVLFRANNYLAKWETHSTGTLVIRVQVWVREIHSDLDDYFNGGLVSLGPIPSGTLKNLRDVDN